MNLSELFESCFEILIEESMSQRDWRTKIEKLFPDNDHAFVHLNWIALISYYNILSKSTDISPITEKRFSPKRYAELVMNLSKMRVEFFGKAGSKLRDDKIMRNLKSGMQESDQIKILVDSIRALIADVKELAPEAEYRMKVRREMKEPAKTTTIYSSGSLQLIKIDNYSGGVKICNLYNTGWCTGTDMSSQSYVEYKENYGTQYVIVMPKVRDVISIHVYDRFISDFAVTGINNSYNIFSRVSGLSVPKNNIFSNGITKDEFDKMAESAKSVSTGLHQLLTLIGNAK